MDNEISALVHERTYARDANRHGSEFWQTEIFFDAPYNIIVRLEDGTKILSVDKCIDANDFRQDLTIFMDGTKSKIYYANTMTFSKEFADACKNVLLAQSALENCKAVVDSLLPKYTPIV